jgi:urease accessory protein
MTSPATLLRLLHLASPALPVGAFHFSQALEYAVHAELVADESSAAAWIEGVGESSLATLDLPVLLRLHEAFRKGDIEAALRWSRFLIAARESAELRAEDRHMGGALFKLLPELGCNVPEERVPCYAAAFACAAARWNIDSRCMLTAFAWTWTENQALAAVKLVPLGQTAGQRLLAAASERIVHWVDRAMQLDDEEIGVATPMPMLLSALHETQYTRLFKS